LIVGDGFLEEGKFVIGVVVEGAGRLLKGAGSIETEVNCVEWVELILTGC
jgi:hypothetical protein